MVLSAVGLAWIERSLWLWTSTNPGHTIFPPASITLVAPASAGRGPTSTILSPRMATSAG